MKHFIEMDISGYGYVAYLCNNNPNSIGDFSSFNYLNYQNWFKYRLCRGKYTYSKKPHYEGINGDKEWYYNSKLYLSYEAYMLAVMR